MKKGSEKSEKKEWKIISFKSETEVHPYVSSDGVSSRDKWGVLMSKPLPGLELTNIHFAKS